MRTLRAALPLPFANFMEEALYGEGGYYRREALAIGEEGDFVTGSSLSSLFGRATARLLQRLDASFDRPAELFEAGYGTGMHLSHVLSFLGGFLERPASPGPSPPSPLSHTHTHPPGRGGTDLFDGEPLGGGAPLPGGGSACGRGDGGEGPGEAGFVSRHGLSRRPITENRNAGRRIRGWDRVPRPVPDGAASVANLGQITDGEIDGLIFSYELFDALPFHRLIGRTDGSVGELWVDRGEVSDFAWREGELSDPALLDLLRDPGIHLQPGQVADLAPGWAPLYAELARKLGRGLLVTCDYGYERERLLDPRVRMHGTLACYSRQRVHRNPFVLVGEQDLTAHVDFTALRRAGEAVGLTTFAFTRQALWLAACGLFEDLQGAPAETRLAAMTLLDGEGMGEDIRVLVQARGIDPAEVLPGLR